MSQMRLCDSNASSLGVGIGLFALWIASSVSAQAQSQAPSPSEGATNPASAPTRALPPAPLPTLPTDPVARVRWLNGRIDEILAGSAAVRDRAKLGISILDLESGRLLYARNDALQLNPASNVKLITTAAALALLGPEFRFKTALYLDKDAKGGRGNLYLRGQGDPTLQIEDLWRLSGELVARGVKTMSGDLIVDDTYFDDQRVGPGFEQKTEDAAFRAPQGAVSLSYNAVSIRVIPAADGGPPRVVLDPPSAYVLLENEARTVASGRTSLAVETRDSNEPGEEHTIVKVRGVLRKGDGAQEFWKRIGHPDLYTGHSFKELLLRRGVKIAGRVIRGTVPGSATLIGTHASPPLGVVVRDINKRSNNFMAEQVLKSLGAEVFGKPGTWKKGLDAVGKFLESVSVPQGRYLMTNGSGLYDANRFSATQMTTVLRATYRDFRYAADFVGSLGVAGADGTIGHRMAGLAERYVRAKTGTLLGVSCLSGYASAPAPPGQPARGPLAFAILMNELPEESNGAARHVQDAIAEAMVLYLGGSR